SAPLMLRGRAGEGSVRRGLSSTQGGIPPPSKTKPVILIDEEGHLSYTTLRKQALITDMALRHRDIRALEPQVALPYPPAILAIVLNLEGLKLIIGREKALVLSVPAPGDLTARCPADLANPLVQQLAAHIAMRAWPGSGDGAEGGLGASFSVATLEEIRGGATLPYELRALEGALLCLVRVLEREVGALERGVRPVLDRIRRGVLRSDLEELYESRTRLVRGLARERIAATEHLVNLDLDARRNQLVSLGLAIDLLLMAFECHMALTSIFGMNLTSGLEPLQPYSLWGIVALGAGAGALLTALQLDPEVAGEEYRSEARRSQPCFAL
ncbi:hypothetical protein APUTEX25_005317, partial [Auxenochlorella protothecoides]